MKVTSLTIALFFCCIAYSLAQTVIGGGAADNSAVLTVNGNNKGVLLPRLTTVQRNGIVSPPDGLMVYDVTTNGVWYYAGSRWLQQYDSLNTLWRQDDNAGFSSSVFNTVGLRWGINTNNAASTVHLNSNGIITGLKFTNIFSGQNTIDGAQVTMGSTPDINISNAEPGGITFQNNAGYNLHIANTGQVGIGTKNLAGLLTFAEVAGEKMNFYNSFSNASYGIGVANNNSLQIHADLPASRVQFGYGRTSTGFISRLTVNGSGEVNFNNKIISASTSSTDLLPIAYGTLGETGALEMISPNATVTKVSTGHYRLTVAGINFGTDNNYVVMATATAPAILNYFNGAHAVEVSTDVNETFATLKLLQSNVTNMTSQCGGCLAIWRYQPNLRQGGISFLVFKN